MESPIGTLTLVNSDGRLSGLYMIEHRHGPKANSLGMRVQSGFEQAESELREYFDGNRNVFTIPLHMEGTEFQQAVWKLLLEIGRASCRERV